MPVQGFDWDGLSSRRMPPPRKPKVRNCALQRVCQVSAYMREISTVVQDEDSAKRKTELESAHKAEAREPEVTPEEQAEWKRVFKDF